MYVADTFSKMIRKVTAAGVVTALAGNSGATGNVDGPGTFARFNFPYGLHADAAGNVTVADTLNHTIRSITPAGVVSTLAGTAGAAGNTDATGLVAQFNNPRDVVADGAGNLFVADSGNHTIRMITPAGVVTTVAGVAGLKGIPMGSAPSGLATPSGVVVIGPNTLAVTSESSVLRIVPH